MKNLNIIAQPRVALTVANFIHRGEIPRGGNFIPFHQRREKSI